MRYRLPSLNALRAFETAGRRGSVTGAAEELGVTPGAVSRHIGMLEAHFGVRLLLRHGRGVSLTAKGQTYFEEVVRAFDGLDRASNDLAGPGSTGVLFVSLYTTLTTEWLASRLDRFRQRHPEVDLRLTVTVERVDFDNEEVDLSIIAGSFRRPDLQEDALFRSSFFPVCSPLLLEREVPLKTPLDLSRHTLLYADRELEMWRAWCRGADIPPLDMRNGLRFDNLSLTYQAARAGGGVALGHPFFLVDDLASGRLVAPFKLATDSFTFHVVYPKARANAPALIAFREWLVQEVATSNAVARALMADFEVMSAAFE
ncbi:MAG: LysR substrate-binding domain-containing protein [Phenylobacterium sp.]|uniref:LysR substrate-binding domain-containing protein n=1 Tax=Phenylobacterium sp. TaxID=1871053 RepID=UPI00273588A0|nr:LysR substrate-binding domain-containing protein [Phenylobacterium sp.]MDP3172823.1 LysR substrate-binding domain-containing protein [Phenylobacterium sp.]